MPAAKARCCRGWNAAAERVTKHEKEMNATYLDSDPWWGLSWFLGRKRLPKPATFFRKAPDSAWSD